MERTVDDFKLSLAAIVLGPQGAEEGPGGGRLGAGAPDMLLSTEINKRTKRYVIDYPPKRNPMHDMSGHAPAYRPVRPYPLAERASIHAAWARSPCYIPRACVLTSTFVVPFFFAPLLLDLFAASLTLRDAATIFLHAGCHMEGDSKHVALKLMNMMQDLTRQKYLFTLGWYYSSF